MEYMIIDTYQVVLPWLVDSVSVSFLVDKSTGLSTVPEKTDDELIGLVIESGSSDLQKNAAVTSVPSVYTLSVVLITSSLWDFCKEEITKYYAIKY